MDQGHPDRRMWVDSYVEEAMGLSSLNTYDVISLEEYRRKYSHVKILPSMCVQTIKKDGDGRPVRAKSRIVALGNHEDRIWEKCETFAPVLRDTTSRYLTSLATEYGRVEKQADAKNAFCNGILPDDETTIVRPPAGCPISRPGQLWLLKKTLYGLRRSPIHWYRTIKSKLEEIGLRAMAHDPCLFYGHFEGHANPVYVGVYVDDLKYFSVSDEVEKIFEQAIGSKLTIDFMGPVTWFLGCKYEHDITDDGKVTVSVTQTAKIEELQEKFGLVDCNPVDTPYRSGLVVDRIEHDSVHPEDKPELVRNYRSIIGGLLWINRQTRPDISVIVSLLSRYNANPSKGHYEAARYVIRYLAGTADRGIRFTQDAGGKMCTNVGFPTTDGTYTDANWGPQDASHPRPGETVEVTDMQSLMGHVVFRQGGPIAWECKRESKTMSRSSCEAEIYATDEGVKTTEMFRNLERDLGLLDNKPTPVWNDNRGTVDWSKGCSVSRKLRHVNIREMGVRLSQTQGDVIIGHIEGKLNISDILTKEMKDKGHFCALAQAITSPRQWSQTEGGVETARVGEFTG